MRGPRGSVEGECTAGRAVVDQEHALPAEPGRGRLAHPERKRRGCGSIDGIAPILQYFDGGGRRQVVAVATIPRLDTASRCSGGMRCSPSSSASLSCGSCGRLVMMVSGILLVADHGRLYQLFQNSRQILHAG